MSRKSSGHKVMDVGGAEVPRGGLSLAGDHVTENVEALMPMISAHFIDAKVRHTHRSHLLYIIRAHNEQFSIYFSILIRVEPNWS